jgi:putative ABC transport system substrate-binding protein
MRFRVALVLVLGLLAAPLAEGQQAGTTTIGFLRTAAPPESYIEAFRQGLKERGYTQGKDLTFEYRWAGGKTDQLAKLAGELVRLKWT